MVVIIFIGLPGSGKSTLAEKLHQKLSSSTYISSDIIRQQLFDHFKSEKLKNQIYNDYNVEIVYNAVLLILREFHQIGDYFVLDASYHLSSRRKKLVDLLDEYNIPYQFFVTTAPESIIHDRIRHRNEINNSEARFEEYLLLKNEWDKIPEIPTYEIIDTSNSIGDCMSSIKEQLEDRFSFFG